MVTTLTTTTSVSDLSVDAQLVQEAIIEALYANDFARQFVIFASIAGVPTTSYDFPKLPSLSASAVAETADIPYTPYATDSVRATVSEVGIVLGLTRLMRSSVIVSDERFSMEAGKAVADKLNHDVMSMSIGFSGSVGPTTGNPLLEDHVLEANATLGGRNLSGPLTWGITFAQKRDLIGDVGTTFTPGGTQGSTVRGALNDLPAAGLDGQMGALYGGTWFVTEAVPTINAGADVSGMVVQSNRAIGYVEKWPASIAFYTDESARVREVIVTAAYALVEVDDNAGLSVQSDAGP